MTFLEAQYLKQKAQESKNLGAKFFLVQTLKTLKQIIMFLWLAITILANQRIHRFKDRGIIGDYKTKTKSLGKFHYRIEINTELTGMQATHLLGNLFPKKLRRFRRRFHD
jgi:hypothetical protein